MSRQKYKASEKWEILLEALASASGPNDICRLHGITMVELRRWLAQARTGALRQLEATEGKNGVEGQATSAIDKVEKGTTPGPEDLSRPTHAVKASATSLKQDTAPSRQDTPHQTQNTQTSTQDSPTSTQDISSLKKDTQTSTQSSPAVTQDPAVVTQGAASSIHSASTPLATKDPAQTPDLAGATDSGSHRSAKPQSTNILKTPIDEAALFSRTCHELKEPVRAVKAFSQFLLEDYSDSVDTRGKRYLDALGAMADRMQMVIEGLSGYAKANVTATPEELISLSSLMENIRLELETFLESRNATVVVDSRLPIVQGDRAGLSRIFKQLMHNGIKFNSSAHPRVEIVLDEEQSRGDTVCILVRDNGIGIEKRYAARIFEPFDRLNRYDEYPGAGIGLATARRAVEARGGSVSLWSEPGEGSIFCLRLAKGSTGGV